MSGERFPEEARRLVEAAVRKPFEAQRAMRSRGLRIDDLGDPMRQLAFTLYTHLAELSEQAGRLVGREEAERLRVAALSGDG